MPSVLELVKVQALQLGRLFAQPGKRPTNHPRIPNGQWPRQGEHGPPRIHKRQLTNLEAGTFLLWFCGNHIILYAATRGSVLIWFYPISTEKHENGGNSDDDGVNR